MSVWRMLTVGNTALHSAERGDVATALVALPLTTLSVATVRRAHTRRTRRVRGGQGDPVRITLRLLERVRRGRVTPRLVCVKYGGNGFRASLREIWTRRLPDLVCVRCVLRTGSHTASDAMRRRHRCCAAQRCSAARNRLLCILRTFSRKDPTASPCRARVTVVSQQGLSAGARRHQASGVRPATRQLLRATPAIIHAAWAAARRDMQAGGTRRDAGRRGCESQGRGGGGYKAGGAQSGALQ